MTKRLNLLPSERVDLPDMQAGTTGIAVGTMQQALEELVIAKFPRIAAGFRLEVANQVTAPGEVTVWNGFAIDRDGRVLQNEDEENTQRSTTLIADGTYYIEVQFLETPSDADARAFWDTTFDNGTDPSGDPRLAGREVFQTVSTRLSPDWTIVSPVSTTGFDIVTSPSSTKVPVAVVTITGGVVTSATTFPARTCIDRTANIGDTQLYVLDSRLMPDSFSATVDAEAIAVSSNDRTNNILTLGGPLTVQHLSGARVVRTGGGLNQFLQARATPPLPTVGTTDARPSLWRGDEDRGHSLAQDPDTALRSDVQIQQLRDEIDFLAAQLREIRFGAERSTDIGQLAPPSSFPALPRYYDRSGGVQGARTCTFSVGDGVASWGDFNASIYGSGRAAIAAAVAALPAAGGTIFIKNSAAPYDFATGFSLPAKNIKFVGESRGGAVLRATGADPAIDLAGASGIYSFDNLTVSRLAAAAAPAAMAQTGFDVELNMRDCLIEGFVGGLAGIQIDVATIINTNFTSTVGGGSNGIAFQASPQRTSIIDCRFVTLVAGAGARALLLDEAFGVYITNCYFFGNGATSTAAVEIQNGTSGVRFTRCVAQSAATSAFLIGTGSTCSDITFEDTVSAVEFLVADNVTDLLISRCTMGFLATTFSISIGSSINNARIVIRDCRLTAATTTVGGVMGGGISATTCPNLTVSNCDILNAACGLQLGSTQRASITDCMIRQNTTTTGRYGILWTSASGVAQDVVVRGCTIDRLHDATDGIIAAITLPASSINVTVADCTIQHIAYLVGTSASQIYGVYMRAGGAFVNVTITGNQFLQFRGGFGGSKECVAVELNQNGNNIIITNNNFTDIGNVAAAQDYACGVQIGSIFIGSNPTIAGVDISNNNFVSIGSTLVTQTIGVALRGTTGSLFGISISNNCMRNFNALSTGFGILTTVGGIRLLSIASNKMHLNGFAFTGVLLEIIAATADPLDAVTITGNVINEHFNGSSIRRGIYISHSGTTTGIGEITIADNSVWGFEISGIEVIGNNFVEGVTITGNVLVSDTVASMKGVYVADVRVLTVCSNSINLAGAVGTKQCIDLLGCEDITMVGNAIRTFQHDSITIGVTRFTDCLRGAVTGNSVMLQSPAAANAWAMDFNSAGNLGIYIAGNIIRQSGGSIMAIVGELLAAVYAGALRNLDGNAALVPTAFSDIGLNWRDT